MKDLQKAQDVVTRAKAQVVIGQPFFASILLRRQINWTESVPTLAVDARAQIYANPTFVAGLSIPECVWALCHECMHVMLMHAQRLGHREQRKWNIAGDAVINDTLTSAGIGSPIAKTVNMPGSKVKTTEQVYDELPDPPPGSGNGGGEGDPLAGDVQSDPGMSEAEKSATEAQIKVEIAQAAQAARMQGKMPAGLERMVEEILFVKTPWHSILERFMTNVSSNDYTWSRPNRRHIADGIYLPSLHNEASMGEMVLGIDTSGSIDDKMLAYFAGHLNRIMETCRPTKIHVVYCDAAVNRVDVFSHDEMPIKLKAVGGGGTDMGEIIRWTDQNVPTASCCVILTDGYTPWPEQPDFPLLVACTTDHGVPIGEVVRVEMEDE